MKKILLGCVLFLAACSSNPKPPEPVSDTRPIVIGEQRIVQSNALGDAREINIWLPPSYGKTDKRYPVLYLIDGALDQDFPHIAGSPSTAPLAGRLRRRSSSASRQRTAAPNLPGAQAIRLNSAISLATETATRSGVSSPTRSSR